MKTRASPGRVGAVRALVDIEDGAFSEIALDEHLPVGQDRDHGWFLVMGVLRRRAEVDAALSQYLRQPLTALDPPVRAVLRLGAFEKLWSRTKPHAVVHQAVEVARRTGAGRASGLVNAILRKVRQPEGKPAVNLPPWLFQRWCERYGEEETRAWSIAALEPPPLVVVVTDPELPVAWRQSGLEVSQARAGGQVIGGAWKIEGHRGPVTRLPGWSAGTVWVQDAAAVAVADLVSIEEGQRVLDACAAPGGKTLRLASEGAEVVAVDRSEIRLERVRENLARTGLSAQICVHDWAEGAMSAELYDAVLVDAPCTALGTLRRSPEVKWRRQEVDLARATSRQAAILDATAVHVRPGGTLVYAVCSPEPEEGEGVIASFLSSHPSFRRDGSLLTAPPADGEDAHQAFRLVREESA